MGEHADTLISWLNISPMGALAVVISTVTMYFLFLLGMRLMGQRILTGMASFDIAAALVFGAVVGRSAIGPWPTLSAGIIAFITLITLQATVGHVTHTRRGDRIFNNSAVLLMAGSRVLEKNLHACHVTRAELYSRLRAAGVRNDDEVAAVIFEPNGHLSILKRGFLIDPELLANVRGAEAMPPGFVGN